MEFFESKLETWRFSVVRDSRHMGFVFRNSFPPTTLLDRWERVGHDDYEDQLELNSVCVVQEMKEMGTGNANRQHVIVLSLTDFTPTPHDPVEDEIRTFLTLLKIGSDHFKFELCQSEKEEIAKKFEAALSAVLSVALSTEVVSKKRKNFEVYEDEMLQEQEDIGGAGRRLLLGSQATVENPRGARAANTLKVEWDIGRKPQSFR